ncbi:MAG: hypothetical protein R6V85_04930 [Polyangia bacterium]
MARGSYSQGKRQREADKARKKREKAERRAQRREREPAEDEIISAEEAAGYAPTPAEAMIAMQERAQRPRPAASVPCRLFVGGLSWDTTQEVLVEVFSQFGAIADAVILTDRSTGRSRGFGFVTFKNRKDGARAVEQLDGTELDGRTIAVNVATER